MLNLSQMHESERMQQVFFQAIDRMLPGVSLEEAAPDEAIDGPVVEVASSRRQYARYAVHSDGSTELSTSDLALLRNAAGLLALLLEKREQEAELERERGRLEEEVARRTEELSERNARLQQEAEQRRDAERRLIAHEADLAQSIQDNPDGAAIVRASDMILLEHNAAFVKLFPEALPDAQSDRPRILPEAHWDLVDRALSAGHATDPRLEVCRPEGGTMLLAASATRVVYQREDCAVLVARDATARIRAERRAAENELRFRELTSSIDELFFLAPAGNPHAFTFVSPAFMTIVDDRPDSAAEAARLWRNAIHPDDRPAVQTALTEFAGQGTPFDEEYRLIRRSGEVRWVWERIFPIDEPNTSPEHRRIAGVVQDVTDWHWAEEAIQASERRFDDMLQTIGLLALIIDRDGRALYANDLYLQVTGMQLDESVDTDMITRFAHPDDAERARALLRHAAETCKAPDVFEIRIKRADGGIALVRWHLSVLTDDDGHFAALSGIGEDVTQLVQNEEALRESEQTMHSLFRAAPNGIAVVRDRHLQWTNPAFQQLFGYTANELAQADTHILYPTEAEYARIGKEHYANLAAFGVSNMEATFCHRNGQPFQALLSSAILDPDDPTKGMVATVTDLTDIHETRDALSRSQAELEINHRVATVFLTAQEEELFAQVLDIVLEATDSRFGFFGFIDENGDLRCPAMTADQFKKNVNGGPEDALVFQRERWAGLWGKALQEVRSQWSNEPLDVPEGHPPLSNAMAVPIVDHGELIGLFAVSERENGYQEEVVSRLERVANYVGPVLAAYLASRRHEIERQANEEHRSRLVAELDHRVKNNLANVIGLMEQTRASTDSMDAFHQKLGGRVRAMAATHETLASRRWEDFEFTDVAKRILRSFDPSGAQLHLPSEPLFLPARYAQPLGLVLHELATNAVKYGALSCATGAIDLTWSKPDPETLLIRWQERGGPPPPAKPKPGLGSRLIDGLVNYQIQGQLVRDYREAGLLCEISLPANPLPGV